MAETALKSYEQHLDADLTWALREGNMFFQGGGEVQDALRRITSRLNTLGIDYAVVGGMALFIHGLRRFTEDVDILVTPDGLRLIHEALEGSGYRPPFPNSKNLRDTENGVRIEFLVAGEFPGDGKPKPVSFPNPNRVAMEHEGIKLVTLRTLIELKLASGMTSLDRLKDLADVQELIKLLTLSEDFADHLDPYVREQYHTLWQSVETVRQQRQNDGEHQG